MASCVLRRHKAKSCPYSLIPRRSMIFFSSAKPPIPITSPTAPNRRFADVVTQRLIKALLDGKPGPYSDNDLAAVASNCTEKGDAARKVEREMSKRLAAIAMSHRVGETFDAIITGVTPKGTFIRVMQPHIEGLLAQGAQ